ncbi:MAG: hypothetical protein QS721_04010 [Candidatus Endonucleobacter sp. (ex Gigantidas childressi)]|nr:hypothetical protein [Candidatus Endonucleobacter sp. (ex Gigantidas childressi)]
MSHNKYKNLQDLVDSYIQSGLSAREYVECCVDAGDISASEALKLLSVLRDAQSVTFKLAEINNDAFPGLKMTLMRKSDNGAIVGSPLFKISIDESLNHDREEVIDILQKFAKDLAVLATRDELPEAEAVDALDESPEDWLNHPNIMPPSNTRH